MGNLLEMRAQPALELSRLPVHNEDQWGRPVAKGPDCKEEPLVRVADLVAMLCARDGLVFRDAVDAVLSRLADLPARLSTDHPEDRFFNGTPDIPPVWLLVRGERGSPVAEHRVWRDAFPSGAAHVAEVARQVVATAIGADNPVCWRLSLADDREAIKSAEELQVLDDPELWLMTPDEAAARGMWGLSASERRWRGLSMSTDPARPGLMLDRFHWESLQAIEELSGAAGALVLAQDQWPRLSSLEDLDASELAQIAILRCDALLLFGKPTVRQPDGGLCKADAQKPAIIPPEKEADESYVWSGMSVHLAQLNDQFDEQVKWYRQQGRDSKAIGSARLDLAEAWDISESTVKQQTTGDPRKRVIAARKATGTRRTA